MKLTGDIIHLRALELSDVNLLYDWENKSEVWEMSNSTSPVSKADLKNYINRSYDIYTEKQLRLMIIRNDDHLSLGTVDLFEADFHHKRAGVGILIAEEGERKKGYANDALLVLKKYCKDILDLKQLFANILYDNLPSQALFEKNKFEKIGVKKDWTRIADEWKDEYLYQCIL